MSTILTLAAAMAMATQCAPNVDARTLIAVAQTESGSGAGLQTLALHDNTTRQSYLPDNVQQAVAYAGELIAHGHSVDLGVMQINSKNLPEVGMSVVEAFDPCKSMRAANTILVQGFHAALRDVFSRYNTGNPIRGITNGYVAKVEANAGVPAVQAPVPPVTITPDHRPPPQPQPEGIFAVSNGETFVSTAPTNGDN